MEILKPQNFPKENFLVLNTSNGVDKRKCVNIYGDFDFKNAFELMPVTDVYELIQEGREIFFMDEDGREVKVESIVREKYKGKIYDVDVENDIVLVRREGKGLWSAKWGNNGIHNNSII